MKIQVPEITKAALAAYLGNGQTWEEAIELEKGSLLPRNMTPEELQALEDSKEEIIAMTK
jgi:hypothetical protein